MITPSRANRTNSASPGKVSAAASTKSVSRAKCRHGSRFARYRTSSLPAYVRCQRHSRAWWHHDQRSTIWRNALPKSRRGNDCGLSTCVASQLPSPLPSWKHKSALAWSAAAPAASPPHTLATSPEKQRGRERHECHDREIAGKRKLPSQPVENDCRESRISTKLSSAGRPRSTR